MNQATSAGPSRAKVVVLLAVAGAALFGVFLGYLAWSNGSFPVQQKLFANYAEVVSSKFNGTEVSFELRWNSSAYLPLYAQLTSATSDSANSPVCGLGLAVVKDGQNLSLPFGIGRPSPILTNLELSIAVKSVATGGEFTIVYHVDSVSAQRVKIVPSNISCRQPASAV